MIARAGLTADSRDSTRRSPSCRLSPSRFIDTSPRQETPCAHFPPSLPRSEEHTSELQSLMRISYAVFCLKKKTTKHTISQQTHTKIQLLVLETHTHIRILLNP